MSEILGLLGGQLKGIGLVLGVLFLGLVVYALVRVLFKMYKKVPPNTVLVVFGRAHKYQDREGVEQKRGFRVITGGGTLVLPGLEETDELSLMIMTLEVEKDDVKSKSGVPISIDWNVQFRFGPSQEDVSTAIPMFLGMSENDIKDKVRKTISGNLRGVIAAMEVEELHADRDKFVSKVQEVISDEMSLMGVQIISMTIQDIYDEVGYFKALSAEKIATVKKDAVIAEAVADRESREKSAESREIAEKAEIGAKQRIAEAQKALEVQQAKYKEEADTAKAAADVAYALMEQELNEQLERKKGAVAIEMKKQEGLAAQEAIAVAEREQKARVIVPAEAAKKAAIESAAGEAEAVKLNAAARAEETRATKEAEAAGILATGEAEAAKEKAALLAKAEGEQQLAEARAAENAINLQQFIVEQMMKARVETAQAFAQALSGMGNNMRVVQFSGAAGAKSTGNVLLDTLMQIPEVGEVLAAKTEALTGKDIPTILAEVLAMMQGVKEVVVPEEKKA